MAKTKYWYHWTAELMLLLFITGTLAVSDLPQYYCDMEDSIKGCMFLKDNNQTCVYPVQSVDGNWSSLGDRCQKGYTRGTWQLTEDFVRIPVDVKALESLGQAYSIERPIVMTQAKVLKDTKDNLYVEGFCQSSVSK